VKKYWKESDFMIRRESMIKIDLRMFPPSVDFFWFTYVSPFCWFF